MSQACRHWNLASLLPLVALIGYMHCLVSGKTWGIFRKQNISFHARQEHSQMHSVLSVSICASFGGYFYLFCFVVSSLNFSTDFLPLFCWRWSLRGYYVSVLVLIRHPKVIWGFEDVFKFSCRKLSSLHCPHGCLASLDFLVVIKQKMQDRIGELTYWEIWVKHIDELKVSIPAYFFHSLGRKAAETPLQCSVWNVGSGRSIYFWVGEAGLGDSFVWAYLVDFIIF